MTSTRPYLVHQRQVWAFTLLNHCNPGVFWFDNKELAAKGMTGDMFWNYGGIL
ncbi:hypothetical protein [Arthrobacter polaris]|uniref:hypothetical protein n=1 Tax=Arthrobacter polaris TaxID=2813727 RepID=UPI001F285ED4|nr:hypothetical protein [Arthrobacter polaris]UIK89044.1 hypothetical protein J0916_00605 [Arthrobacter polaris]